MASPRGLLAAAILGTAAAQNRTTVTIPIPSGLSTRLLVPDVYGYSIEPVWLDSYTSTPLARTLLGGIANVTGKAPPIRVGGNTADQTYLYPSSPLPLTGNDSVAIPEPMTATAFNITPRWFDSWATYFPAGTELIYTLNLADNSSGWANAVAQAAAARAGLGEALTAFELGNEIDHFINKGWRDAAWGVAAYIEQFRNVTGQITGSDWYQALLLLAAGDDEGEDGGKGKRNGDRNGNGNGNGNGRKRKAPTFQAAVFADPPLVPDQHDEPDDFSIANLTAAGIAARPAERAVISSYATHLYPQSTCDEARRQRLRLDLLSDHAVLWRNVSQFIPQVKAAESAGAPLVMGETNSASCSGRSGISDTFGAALWAADYALTAAALGLRRVYFHLGARSEYAAFTPLPYPYKNESLAAGLRAPWYAHYFVARVVAASPSRSASPGAGGAGVGCGPLRVAALPGANSSALSGFAIYSGGGGGGDGGDDGRGGEEEEVGEKVLRKLVFLDMGVWNGTDGLANPSTLSATDGAAFSAGERPVSSFRVATPWPAGRDVGVVRMTGPGTNAKSGVAVAGTVFDDRSGEPVVGGGGGGGGLRLGEEYSEVITVGEQGILSFDVRRAEGVLLEVGGGDGCRGAPAAGDDAEDQTPATAGAGRGVLRWGYGVVAGLVGVLGFMVV
ncbi:putative glycoside hydrolase family 79 protein [Rosellinia necatrix]|uniref:Putative glycoside hydrolase family 79 protein n=1 Tax=Rosellinia necatrix TaxID=77044 RepID=A0A1S8A8B0_ROSNE|nr:putative glycoside hydrolase family 79 protein [Rosellinia necatrix]